MIGAGHPHFGQDSPCQFAKTTLHPVADYGRTDLLGDGDAEPHCRIAVLALAHEQDEAGRRHPPAAIGGEKIGAAADRGQPFGRN
jgi:hypothetical protein